MTPSVSYAYLPYATNYGYNVPVVPVDHQEDPDRSRSSPEGLTELDYHSEAARLASFHTWELTLISSADFARAGFYSLNQHDSCRCAFCHNCVGDWVEGDDPMTEHRALFPLCPFVQGHEVGNIPLEVQGEGGHQPTRQSPGNDETGIRWNSNHTEPNTTPEKAPYGASPESIGIMKHAGPLHPQYAALEARLRTSREWPPALRQQPKQLAEAEFYYIGLSDQVKCFYCDGGLRNWQSEDDFGQYNYGLSNPTQTKQKLKTVDGVTHDSYSYVDAKVPFQTVRHIGVPKCIAVPKCVSVPHCVAVPKCVPVQRQQYETVIKNVASKVCNPKPVTSCNTFINQIKVGAHPNIVEMATVFADQVPALPGAVQLCGEALPVRLNPSGYGRNMSLFLVMKKYDMNLAEYLSKYSDQITARTSLILLTQLLEGICYLSSHGVAHRDLKCDNLLLSLSGGAQFPQLVITDFGCCLSDSQHKLRLPYRSWDTDKGGNAALMALEVATARPSSFTSINYERSDVWTAGTLAYEIFGGKNPLYGGSSDSLNSCTYTPSKLPPLPHTAPWLVSRLVTYMLARRPTDRPTPRVAATICQLLLWAPSSWYKVGTQDILQWLLNMTTKVLCESRWGNTAGALLEYQLVATFLTSMSMGDIRSALYWIQEHVDPILMTRFMVRCLNAYTDPTYLRSRPRTLEKGIRPGHNSHYQA